MVVVLELWRQAHLDRIGNSLQLELHKTEELTMFVLGAVLVRLDESLGPALVLKSFFEGLAQLGLAEGYGQVIAASDRANRSLPVGVLS